MLAKSVDHQNASTKPNGWEGYNEEAQYKEETETSTHQYPSFLRSFFVNPFLSNINDSTDQIQSKSSDKESEDIQPSIEEKEKEHIEEFKGVQGLRNFWNSRISAIREARQKSSTLGNSFSKSNTLGPKLAPSKSIGCLVHERSQTLSPSKCRSCDSGNSESSNHLNKTDNFYKYKTADSKNRGSLEAINDIIVCDSSDIHRIQEQRRVKVLPQKQHSFNCINFPAVASTPSGGKIHWATREDIIRSRKLKQVKKSAEEIVCKKINEQSYNGRSFVQDRKRTLERKSQIENEKEEFLSQQRRHSSQASFIDLDKRKLDSVRSNSYCSCRVRSSSVDNSVLEMAIKSLEENKIMAPKSTQNSASNQMTKTTDKTDSSRSQSGSTNSLSSDSPVRKTNSASRKCSFKTRNYHHPTPRKMAVNSSGSKVAALTHRFNQLIQQDAAILEEVKQNNGILLSYGGHVYKVKREPSDAIRKKALAKRSSTNNEDNKSTNSSLDSSKTASSCKRRPSQRRNQKVLDALSGHSGAVKAVIEHFETKADGIISCSSSTSASALSSKQNSPKHNSDTTIDSVSESLLAKPKIPTKSEQVLLLTKEIALRNSQKKLVFNPSKLKSDVIQDEGAHRILEEIKEERSPVVEFKEFKPTPEETVRVEAKNETPTPLQTDNVDSSKVSESKPSNETETEDTPSKKSKYARLYEKLKFRSPFSKKSTSPPKGASVTSPKESEFTPEANESQIVIEAFNHIIQSSIVDISPTMEPPQPEQKIIDALEEVNRRIEHLSKSTNNLSERSESCPKQDDLSPDIQPNNSFLFRMNSKNHYNSIAIIPDKDCQEDPEINEAVNTRLINKTHSMDEIRLSGSGRKENTCSETNSNNNSCNSSLTYVRQVSLDRSYPDIFKQTDELLERFKQQEEEDLYEPITPMEEQTDISHFGCRNYAMQKSFLYKSKSMLSTNTNQILDDIVAQNDLVRVASDAENIYQTVEEARRIAICKRDSISVNSYESFANYESVGESTTNPTEDDYEHCNPPEPPPPRKSEPDIRATLESGEQPPLPVPKRNIPCTSNNKLETLNITPPPRPNKSPNLNRSISADRPKLPDIPQDTATRGYSSHNSSTLPANSCPISMLIGNFHDRSNQENEHDEHVYDDENIYDTIKNGEASSHCYESITSKNAPKSLDSMSIASNCYESINSIRRMPPLKHSDSISTLSSEQKTNSLYGMTLGQNGSTPQNEGSSDNSDEWIDISDGEDDVNIKHQFIVVRERTKCHRSPDWSKRVRDQRIHQQPADLFDDDSDHYYEPLYTKDYLEQKAGTPTAETSSSLMQHNQHNLSMQDPTKTPQLVISDHNYTPEGDGYSDDYDSFDTDDETDEDVKKNDSGVDISNTRLPDPPTPTNQVYAFVKKIKNFGSLSKSFSKISNRKSSTPKIPEAVSKSYETSQFYTGNNQQQTSPTTTTTDTSKSQKSSKVKTPKISKKLMKLPNNESYENTDFQTPQLIIIPTQVPDTNPSPVSTNTLHSSSEKNLADTSISAQDLTASRKKSRTYKSFKSKIRKSLGAPDTNLNIGGTLNGTRSTFYISDSVDVDSGIFEKNPSSDTNLSQTASSDSQQQLSDSAKSATTTRKSKKSTSPELNRRKTMSGVRPSNPPPPPPENKKGEKKRTSSTSWYAECGVFKATTINDEMMLKDGRQERSSSTSWYAEAGLYQTSGASVASSSGSSGVSTGGEGGPGDDNSHSMFLNEPLYQIYSAAKLESISRDIEDQDSTDGYEEIGTHGIMDEPRERKSSRPSALQLVGPKQGPSRTLWSEIPEVINSEILSTLTPTEKRLQEAKFEILTSEASYLKSLNLLKTHFMDHPAFRDTQVLSYHDRKTLFSCIVPVQQCSDRLLCDLESVWQNNIMLIGLSKSIHKHADKYFHVYVSFCEHQGKMDRTLRKLKESNHAFTHALEQLETDPVCCGLNLHSFLMLPMQRITRLPLLIDAVFSKVKPDDDEYESWKMTLTILNKIVVQCNEAANRCEQAYEIEKISRQIEFPSTIRSIAIAPVGIIAPGRPPRSLVRKGELVHLIPRGDDAKLTFGKKFMKTNIYAFLFTDLFILTKRKGEEQFSVFDYCPRSMLTVSLEDDMPQLASTKEIIQTAKNLLYITILENHEAKNVRMIVSCPSISEQQRWIQATSPPEPENPDEKIYDHWDCPQVIAKHEFIATEPDLLNLEPGDTVNVTRKMPDGWYQGERIRDGATGWFPGNYTEEINSQHVRARNLRQRNRLLALTATYLESQKRNNEINVVKK